MNGFHLYIGVEQWKVQERSPPEHSEQGKNPHVMGSLLYTTPRGHDRTSSGASG